MKKSILLSVFLLVSCGTGSGGSDKLTFGETVGSAWLIYQDGDYTAAYLAFGEALTNFGSMPFDSLARAHAGTGLSAVTAISRQVAPRTSMARSTSSSVMVIWRSRF